MNKKTLTIVGAGFVGVVALIGLLVSAGNKLPDGTKKAYQAEVKAAKAASDAAKAHVSAIEGVMSSGDALKALAANEGWQGTLDKAKADMAEVDTMLASAKKLHDNNERKDRVTLENLVSSVKSRRTEAVAALKTLEERSKRVARYEKEGPAIAEKAKAMAKNFLETPLPEALTAKVEQAKTDCEKKARELAKRQESLAQVQELVRRAEPRLDAAEGPIAKGVAGDDLIKVIEGAQNTIKELDTFSDQLYYSRDRVLTDLEESGGKYSAKIKTVTVDRDDKQTETEKWEPISRADYNRYKDNLGMTIGHKGRCEFEADASKTIQPPGYAYVGNKRYGRWRTDSSGTRFWEFYGQYMFMRTMFWGPTFGPVYYNDYNRYRSAYSSGRTYYGTGRDGSRRFGSSGSHTRKRYSSSKFAKGGGFKSGSSSKGRSSSSRSSGSRFGGK